MRYLQQFDNIDVFCSIAFFEKRKANRECTIRRRLAYLELFPSETTLKGIWKDISKSGELVKGMITNSYSLLTKILNHLVSRRIMQKMMKIYHLYNFSLGFGSLI